MADPLEPRGRAALLAAGEAARTAARFRVAADPGKRRGDRRTRAPAGEAQRAARRDPLAEPGRARDPGDPAPFRRAPRPWTALFEQATAPLPGRKVTYKLGGRTPWWSPPRPGRAVLHPLRGRSAGRARVPPRLRPRPGAGGRPARDRRGERLRAVPGPRRGAGRDRAVRPTRRRRSAPPARKPRFRKSHTQVHYRVLPLNPGRPAGRLRGGRRARGGAGPGADRRRRARGCADLRIGSAPARVLATDPAGLALLDAPGAPAPLRPASRTEPVGAEDGLIALAPGAGRDPGRARQRASGTTSCAALQPGSAGAPVLDRAGAPRRARRPLSRGAAPGRRGGAARAPAAGAGAGGHGVPGRPGPARGDAAPGRQGPARSRAAVVGITCR